MGHRFVDASVIRARMDAKDARIAREMAERQKKFEEVPHCPRCGSYAWIYKGDVQACADCGR